MHVYNDSIKKFRTKYNDVIFSEKKQQQKTKRDIHGYKKYLFL